MIHQYEITGMTCSGCAANVTKTLEQVPGVKSVKVNLAEKAATIEMSRHLSAADFQKALGTGKYTITEKTKLQMEAKTVAPIIAPVEEQEKTNLQRLYPLFLIFAYLFGTVLLVEMASGSWDNMRFIQHFMGGFFLVFSFFKFLDLQGFASSFRMYDPLAQRWMNYGSVYPFIELGLGIGFLLGLQLWLMSFSTLIILGIGTIGVAKTVLDKKKIKCACLGTVFNLPMTKVTLIENSIMLVMAVGMLVSL